MSPEISIRGLSVRLGKTAKNTGNNIIEGLDLDIVGHTACLFGRSGCGKTTLLNVLAGLVKPDLGSVSGVPERVSYLFQEDRLLPWVDALENVCAAAQVDADIAGRWLLRLGLREEDMAKLPRQLSGGMRRRVAIARALAYGGDLLLLDEPFRGLDEARREELMALLKELVQGRRLVLVTHDIYEAESLCRQIIRMDGPPLVIV